ncbi:ArsC/Spx/MgsR family protein [Zobellia laminariae]|uniref:ArsC/Spx/MgsR family protein n=1 Tax=Zobellia laminariae TaxID=248906 RepID=UPI0012D92EEF|nr:hypothetical protein [Zobellia laminariae]
MGDIATSSKQITFYYSSKSLRAKQALAYAKAEGLPVEEIDLLKNKLTGTQILELAERLQLEVADLVNKEIPAYKKHFKQYSLSTDDWIKMIRYNPEIIKQPIALRGNKTILVKNPIDITKL